MFLLKAIMKRVGHVDEKTTIRIYTHVTEKMDRELTQKLETFQVSLNLPFFCPYIFYKLYKTLENTGVKAFLEINISS